MDFFHFKDTVLVLKSLLLLRRMTSDRSGEVA